MRAFAWFVGTLVAAGLVTAIIAYPVYRAHLSGRVVAVSPRREPRGHAGRGRGPRLALPASRRELEARPRLWLALAQIPEGCAGIRHHRHGHRRRRRGAAARDASGASSARRIPSSNCFCVGLSSGIAVALIEETVMRGAMHSAIARESGQWAAVLFTAPLFAVLHFFAKARIPVDQLHWGSGFDLLARSFAPLGTPSLVFDSFMAWLAVSLVLSLTRVLTGNIAAAIGLHAGWVVVLRMLQEATAPGPAAAGSAWLGKFDGLLGYWVLPWAAAIAARALAHPGLWVPYARGRPDAAGTGRRRRQRSDRRQPVEALERIIDLQVSLLVGERYRQISPPGDGPPRRHRRAAYPCSRTPRRAAATRCSSNFDKRACRAGTGTSGSRAQPLHLAEIEPVRLPAALDQSKSLPARRRKAPAGHPTIDGNR